MKTFIKTTIITISLFVSFGVRAQDTIYKQNKVIIPAKVLEIGLTDIKYKDFSNQDGPVITIRRSEVIKIRYENGTETLLAPDKYSVHQEAQILDKVNAIEAEIFTPIRGTYVLGYERMLKIGTNLELKAGLIASQKTDTYFTEPSTSRGGFFKAGIKFLGGQDYVMEGMRYAHPLKGRYIKPEIVFTSFRETNVHYQTFFTNYYSGSADLQRTALALNILFGKQWILGNLLTLDIYIGTGYGWSNTKVKTVLTGPQPDETDWDFRGGYYSHTYFGKTFPLTLTGGMTIGGIF